MKKILNLVWMLMVFAVPWAWAQPSATLSPNNVNAGYSGTLTVTGTNTNFSVATYGMNLTLTHIGTSQAYNFGNAPFQAGFWTSPSHFSPITTFSGNITLPANAPLGYYNLTLNGFGDGGGGNYYLNVPSAFSIGYFPATFTGKVMVDMDSSCSQTAGDIPLASKIVTITPGPFYATTNSTGTFSIALPLGTYTFTVPGENGLTSTCPVNNTQNATNNVANSTVSGVDFFMKRINAAQTDISTNIVCNPQRPGFDCGTWTSVQNATYTTANNVQLKVVKPSTYTWLTQFPSTYTYTTNGDTLIWTIGNMAPGAVTNIYSLLNLPANTPLSSLAIYKAFVSTSSAESNLVNNYSTDTAIVTGSYDPNDKRVWTNTGQNADGFILPTDSLLRYMIRFQNTGTDTAFNIHVRDTMDLDLNMATFRVVSASHNYQVLTDSSGKNMDFFFPNILLLDSNSNEPLSHGYIEYTVRKKNNLNNGTSITNKASIYFDFNAPIVTNQVNSVICPLMPSTFSHAGTTLAKTFTGPTGGLINSYQWNFGDGGTATTANASHTYATGGNYTVCLRITNSCGRVDTICQTIQVGCQQVAAQFSNTASNLSVNFTGTPNGAISTYLWDFGDGNTGSGQTAAHVYAAAGTYQVCLSVVNICGDTSTSCQSLTVVCPTPSAGYSYTSNLGSVTFTDGSTGATSWSWDFGDGNTSTQQNPVHVYATSGTYNVCLTSTNDCGPDTYCEPVLVNTVSIGQGSIQQVNLMPNPALGDVSLVILLGTQESLTIEVSDLLGRKMFTVNRIMAEGETRLTLPTAGLTSGVYHVVIKHSSGMLSLPLRKID